MQLPDQLRGRPVLARVDFFGHGKTYCTGVYRWRQGHPIIGWSVPKRQPPLHRVTRCLATVLDLGLSRAHGGALGQIGAQPIPLEQGVEL
jgi:hypothetical protein